MVTMVKTVEMAANVRMKLYVISELGRATVLLDGRDKRVMKVSYSSVTMSYLH